MSGNADGLYPIMLRLEGKCCIVAGGGPVATRKVSSLLDAGADRIVVISDRLTEQLDEWEHANRICVERRHYRDGDLAEAWLAFACTNDPLVNRRIAADAERLRIWVNVADDGESGNLVTPAIVRRGQLIIALTTGGASPALAARLKKELEQQFGDDYVPRLRVLHLLRERLLGRSTQQGGGARLSELFDPAKRSSILRAAANDELGWQAVAAMLPVHAAGEDEKDEIIVHTIELGDSLDQWILELSGQLA